MQNPVVIPFYKFIKLSDPDRLALAHKEKAKELGLLGRMIIAEEGVNATFEGEREKIEEYVRFLHCDARFADVVVKESAGNGKAFTKLSVKVRDEVVTLGVKDFDVKKETATELPASDLQSWYEKGEDFVVLDLRNDYEIASGKFDRTIDLGLQNFRELPEKLEQLNALKTENSKLKIVTVCTGGIRCEKATCLLKREGFSNLYQLKDGIHTYMKEYPGQNWKGTLFVFDNRMTTDVVPTPNKEIIGRCVFCESPTEAYYSDDSLRPSKKILCCDSCYALNSTRLREANQR